ncbi:hypothetical protein PaG_05391 [Moesziomyces aphidis]|uniref:Uncharacterized protein n=1 Tax=Moesziomyces aphidis TaxID=84754 RepID=W3VFW4_MOEAP|nr:hypothetical protein PaG_05391 [Moesziomyces aphidis]
MLHATDGPAAAGTRPIDALSLVTTAAAFTLALLIILYTSAASSDPLAAQLLQHPLAFRPPTFVCYAAHYSRTASQQASTSSNSAVCPRPARIPHADDNRKCLPSVRACDRYSLVIPAIALVTFPARLARSIPLPPRRRSGVWAESELTDGCLTNSADGRA